MWVSVMGPRRPVVVRPAPWTRGSPAPLLSVLLLLSLHFCTIGVCQENGISCAQSQMPAAENPKDGACGDMDIKNSPHNLMMLENCTVVEGSVHIYLMDYVHQEEYDKYSFPKLREITGHLMLYRLFGMRTLRNLFPNLAVIRGQKLFFNSYALVVNEMRDLEELGLVGLTAIMNGAVRLTKNPKLCHISSVDWGRLASGVNPSLHQFINNREEQLCPDFCNMSCVITTYGEVTRRRCWTPKPGGCQRNLDCKCAGRQACTADGTCCHPYCMGGCFGPTASECFSCRNVIYKDECKPVCPPSTYMMSGRRCLTDKECLALPQRSHRANGEDKIDQGPKLLTGTGGQPSLCVFSCPTGYMVQQSKERKLTECVLCRGFCPKVCNSSKVYSIEDSERLRGCSIIDGYLEIQLMSGKNLDNELTKNLGRIREVTTYLKVSRSYALLTLHFFQSLEIIGGKNGSSKGPLNEYSLVVMDNLNLKELFPEKQMDKMEVRSGLVTFHGNRQLCFHKIEHFVKQLGIKPNLDKKGINRDISNTTNGDLIPCKEVTLNLVIQVVKDVNVVILTWESFILGDPRTLLSYLVYYKPVTERVADYYQGRDICTENEWTTKDVAPTDANMTTMPYETNILGPLKPFTKFAVYVEAYTLTTAHASARTKVHYFETSPTRPSRPVDLQVTSSDPHELMVKWKPPQRPNGVVTHYKVLYSGQTLNTEGFEQRDYCQKPMTLNKELQKAEEKKKQEAEAKKKKEEANKEQDIKCCECGKDPEELLEEQRQAELEIAFENKLHGLIYQKIISKECVSRGLEHINKSSDLDLRQKRSVRSINRGLDFNHPVRAIPLPGHNPQKSDVLNGNISDPQAETNDTSTSSTVPTLEVIVYHTQVTLSNLAHFQIYSIEVVACHETNPTAGKKLCSESAMTSGRTLAHVPSDNINASLISVETMTNRSGEVMLKWMPPAEPNGLILQYNIKYKRVDLERETVPEIVCVNPRVYHNNSNGYLLTGLAPGNYSFQISAYSMAGNGSYTPRMFFSVLPPPGTDDSQQRTTLIVLGVVAVIFILSAASILVCCYVKRTYKSADVTVSQNPHYIATDELYAPDEWEVPRDNIRLIKELGQGSFGKVYEGLMEDPETNISNPVAIKTVTDKADFSERMKILKEATTMKVFECHHVVKLLGVVSKGQPALVIMELMAHGDLRNHLRKCREDEEDFPDFHPPTANQIRQMAGEIADGMAYLADKKIVHRDLAARNCLVAEDGTVKIADFGMARDVYMTEYYRKDQRALLPVRWMAPESLRDGIFTTMSDIWSYGIVLWEMVTLAEQPYQGLGNDEVLRFVTEGRVMSAPIGCPVDLYELMERCWAYNPKHRPTFKYLIELSAPHLSDRFREVSYFFKEVVRSDAEDEEDEEELEEHENDEEMMDDEEEEDYCEDDKTEVDRDFEDSEKLMKRMSDGEDSMMAGGSPIFSANSDEDGEEETTEEESNPYILSGPAQISPGSPSVSHIKAHPRDFGIMAEHSPLLLHQGNIQEPLLYPPPSSGTTDQYDFDNDDDHDLDSEDDFTNRDERMYARPSKDAKSSSERLKLLSDMPPSNRQRPKMGLLSLGANKGGVSAKDSEYTLMSPTTKPTSSSKLGEKSPVLSSQSYVPPSSLPMSTPLTTKTTTTTSLSNAHPSSTPSLPSVTQSLASTTPSSSSSLTTKPILHVDLKPIDGLIGANFKHNPGWDSARQGGGDLARHSGGDDDLDLKSDRSHQNNNLMQRAGNSRGNKLSGGDGGSNSDSNTNSIQSGSDGGGSGGSKESSSSSGSHHHLNPGAANGRGPFPHQQAALC